MESRKIVVMHLLYLTAFRKSLAFLNICLPISKWDYNILYEMALMWELDMNIMGKELKVRLSKWIYVN